MTTLHIPVLIAELYSGEALAVTVEGEPVSALGASAPDALRQLRAALGDRLKRPEAEPEWASLLSALFAGDPGGEGGPLDGLPLDDARLLQFTVPVRPEYRTGDEVFACAENVPVRAAVVWGKAPNGLFRAAAPLLGVEFRFGGEESLRELVHHYVRAALDGSTPRQLSRLLPPKSVSLDELAIRVPTARPRERQRWQPVVLASVADRLVDAASAAPSRAFERSAEVASLHGRLANGSASLLLLGEAGVGKTTILLDAVRGLPRAAADRDRPALLGEHCWRTGAGRLVSGMKYLGQWQERCEAIVAELASVRGVLAVESLTPLLRLGGDGPATSLAAFLAPFVRSGELRLVVEATPAERDACRRLLPSFVDGLETFDVPSMTDRSAMAALDRFAEARLRGTGTELERGTTDLVHRLYRRFHPYDGVPGRSTTFLSSLCEEARREKAPVVTPDRALRLFVRRTGLPEIFLRDESPLNAEDVAAALRRDVLGQDAACDVVAEAVAAFKAGVNDPGRPLSVLLFAGPTGVGKTALARALARFCFGQGEKADRLVRLDLSEYGTPGAAGRLLGESDDEPPEWIRRVREQPFCVLLLDEVEKAAPRVFDVLLGLLDEGRLTDRLGRLTRFTSAFIVMTTNLGAAAKAPPGFGEAPPPSWEKEVMGFFRPELFNRIDRVVPFAPLSRDTLLAITRKELSDLALREGLVRARLKLSWDDAVVEHLARAGFDPLFGARPLQRALERQVVAPLARLLAEHPELTRKEVRLSVRTEEGIAIRVESAP